MLSLFVIFTISVHADDLNPRVSEVLNSADFSKILLSEVGTAGNWQPSTMYKKPDFIEAVKKMAERGVGNFQLYNGPGDLEARMSLVNLAAFLAQSMQETIRYDACDENNWDSSTGYSAANACGQKGQSYQDYKCFATGEEHMACDVDNTLSIRATTHSQWWGAPAPLFCAPKSKVPNAPKWDNMDPQCGTNNPYNPLSEDEFWSYVAGDTAPQCRDYDGQKAGQWKQCPGGCANAPAPAFDREARTDVEGCCYWGRGVIQTTGVCNFGKLNYFAGKRAADEGRDSLYPEIDFCREPYQICTNPEYGDLKWVAGMFYWTASVQTYEREDQHDWAGYREELQKFVEAQNVDFESDKFITKVSGIVNRGCPSTSCGAGPLHGLDYRIEAFKTVLEQFDFANWGPIDPSPVPTTAAPQPNPNPTTAAPQPNPTTAAPQPNPTTAAPQPTQPQPVGDDCRFCTKCESSGSGNGQWISDSACAQCAKGGYEYWPCDVQGGCTCSADAEPYVPEVRVHCNECDECVAVEGKGQTDETCAPCARGGQAWWPCDQGTDLCKCASAPQPVPTTQAPVPITEAPVPITEAPVPITEAPVPITEAPVPITEAPVPTTEAPLPPPCPGPTTQAPTTQAPEPITTQAPEPVTTQAPEPVTTQAPEPVTTQAPEPVTTQAPTTQAPTTQAPEPITEAPTTQAPTPITEPTPWNPQPMQCPQDGFTMPNLPTSSRRNSCNVTPAKCTEKKVVAYYTNWGIYDRNYQPMDVAADKITHINYAFVDLKENCSVELYDAWSDVDKNFQGGCVDAQPWGEQNRGNFDALKQLRSKYPHLKILLSFGGWTLSTYFSSCTKNQQTRDSVAKQIGEIVEKFEMDGADLDWEYPGFPGMEGNTQDPADPENYLLLIKEIRNHMGAGKPVTIASGMNPEYIEMMSQNNVLQRLCEELDWVNLMTYDYAGSWNNYTGHLAPLHPSGNDLHRAGWDIASGVDMMIQAGCPAEKMVLGLPFYGRSWSGVRPGNSNGLFVMEAEPGCGSFEPANRDFTDIDLNMVGKDGYVRYWDDVCKVPYLYKESTGEFVTYDDEESIGYKVKYANEMNLGGVMFWELSNDREEKLLDTITGTLDGCTQNPEPSPVTQAPAPATCVAIPNNPHWATDDSCAQCATGYEWWPCNMTGACDCSGLRRRTFDIQV